MHCPDPPVVEEPRIRFSTRNSPSWLLLSGNIARRRRLRAAIGRWFLELRAGVPLRTAPFDGRPMGTLPPLPLGSLMMLDPVCYYGVKHHVIRAMTIEGDAEVQVEGILKAEV